MIKLTDMLPEMKISKSYKPTRNTTGTVSIGSKHFIKYMTPAGDFYSEVSKEDWKEYKAADASGETALINRLLSKSVDKNTFNKKNPTKSFKPIDHGGYLD